MKHMRRRRSAELAVKTSHGIAYTTRGGGRQPLSSGLAMVEAAGLGECLEDQLAEILDFLGLGQPLRPQSVLQSLGQERDARQMLSQAIMEILSDAGAFALTDLQDFFLQEPAVGDVARDGDHLVAAPDGETGLEIAESASDLQLAVKGMRGTNSEGLLDVMHHLQTDRSG